jgi:hypothetical protein
VSADRASQLIAELQADPALAAQVLPKVRLAVRRGNAVHVLAPYGAGLGGVTVIGVRFLWWVHWRVDLEPPHGIAETESEAWTCLVRALAERGWPVVQP